MSNGREQAKWDKYRQEAGKNLKNRVSKKEVAIEKGKFVTYITTRRVRFDHQKKKYIPLEEKQSVEVMDAMDYEIVVEKIWQFYEQQQTFCKKDYDLFIITGVWGPKVFNTTQLDNKKDLFVLFENKKFSKNKSKELSSDEVTILPSDNHKFSASTSKKRASSTIPPSLIPPSLIPLSKRAIMEAAWEVTAIADASIATVYELSRQEQKWVWLPGFEIKYIDDKEIASGTYRTCYNIKIVDFGRLPKTNYVIKDWKTNSIASRQQDYEYTLETSNPKSEEDIIQELSRRAVQCQHVARGLASEFQKLVTRKISFGKFLRYVPSYLFKINATDTYYTLEEKINGQFVKYLNNDMRSLLIDNDFGLKSSALAHFSLIFSDEKIILTDLQGHNEVLTDPEIGSLYRYDTTNDDTLLYGIGNFGEEALTNFMMSHTCNKFCNLANLTPLKINKKT